eukprot:COSAG05_NODE_23067_length_260_cov_0.962733_1_plen_48_part_01
MYVQLGRPCARAALLPSTSRATRALHDTFYPTAVRKQFKKEIAKAAMA